jgi:hypothetical protein
MEVYFRRREIFGFPLCNGAIYAYRELHLAVKSLIGSLEKYPRGQDIHRLVFVFDEASSLFHASGSSKSDSGRYIALNRLFSCLRAFPVWFFLLSTESEVEKILPADTPRLVDEDQQFTLVNRSSARDAFKTPDEKLEVFPPFVAFPLDVEDRRKMRDPASREIKLAKPMIKFSEAKHMVMFGRSLWYAYTNIHKMYSVARRKIIGGNYEYNPRDKHHVFAVLSFRLALDACVESTISLPLLRTAVGSYMRVVISMDQRTGFLHTTSPSEPVLAHAAMQHLCGGKWNWSKSIDTLSLELLHQGLIEKGLKGELFSRLLLILAHDSLYRTISSSVLELDMPTFAVKDFLLALYAPDYHSFILMIEAQILEARMNFTHFALTSTNLLPGDVTIGLCHDLLRRRAALQLNFNNPTFDQLIPIYFGREEDPFDRSKCGAIVIQNKNREAATSPDYLFGEKFDKIGPEGKAAKPNKQRRVRLEEGYAFRGIDHPVLFLLFDLGAKPGTSGPIQVSRSTDRSLPPLWAIQSRGYTEAVFRCIGTMEIGKVAEDFFATSTAGGRGIYNEIARRNLVFDYMPQSSRYASPKADGSGFVEGWRDFSRDSGSGGGDIEEIKEDTPMADA